MAKAASPVRLQAELMQAATDFGRRQHRSAAEQIEYWASLGRMVAKNVNVDHLLEVSAGFAQLQVVPIEAPVIDPDDVFAALEQDRAAGTLAGSVTQSAVRYQASLAYPGKLEQIDAQGEVTVGEFSMGVFTAMEIKKV